jgi:hypothetical protein
MECCAIVHDFERKSAKRKEDTPLQQPHCARQHGSHCEVSAPGSEVGNGVGHGEELLNLFIPCTSCMIE